MNLAGIAIKRPVFIVMIVLSIITLGALGFSNLAWDLMPNVEFPSVTVTVIYPGASAEEMEALVAKPLEDSFTVLEGIDKVNTSCRESMAMITASFKLGVDIKFAEIKVREKVAITKPFLPKDVQEPIIQRFSFSDIPIQYMSLSGQRDSATLRELLNDEIKPKIETLQGVGSVSIFGGQQRIVKITLNKALLLAKGISINQVQNAMTARNLNFPAGVLEGVEKDITVRILGEFKNTEDIANMPLTSSTGKIVRIKDIAKVDFTVEKEEATVRVNKKTAVMFAVYKQSGANSVKVAENVLDEVKEIQKTLPAGIELASAGDMTAGIKRSVEGVLENIIIGAILAVLIVWLFLGNFRSAIITAAALPNSIMGAFFLIWISDFSINTITLLSLSLAVGLLIDDSIVVRENIFRHIEEGMEVKKAAEFGTNEVGLAVISTTLSIMAVFIPISFLSGMVGQFFKQFGLTVAFALLISLVDAFTTAPMLSAYWYKAREKTKKKRNAFVQWFYDISAGWENFYREFVEYYKEILEWALDNKRKVVFTLMCLFIASISIIPFIGSDFMNADRGFFSVNFETYPGAPLEKMDGYIKEVEAYVSSEKSVDSYFSMAGSNGVSSVSNMGMVFVAMKSLNTRAFKPWSLTNPFGLLRETQKELENKVRKHIKELKMDKPYNATIGMMGADESSTPILINITGPDLNTLRDLSVKVKKIIMETPGSADVDTSLKPGKPEIVLKIDGIKAEKLGVSTAEAGGIIRTLVQGVKVSSLKNGEKEYDINMQLDENSRRSVDDIKNMIITTRTGKKVPIAAICDFEYSSGPSEIRREDKIRIVKISANVAPGYNNGTLNEKIKKRLDTEIKLPDGYKFETGGSAKQFKDLGNEMLKAILLAILFMYMILGSLYNSFVQPLYIMVAIPLAVIGAFLALLITGTNLSLFGFIGLLMVIGLVAKNGILLLDFTNKMRREGLNIREAILHAAPIRLRPILMTTFAMIFGMMPIALSLGEGSKGREGLAIVVIGGLITSTFLTLVAVPVVYEWMEKKLIKSAKK